MEEDPRQSQRAVVKFYEVPAQEEIMVEWAKVRARRGVPMSLALLGSYATHVCGRELGASWPQRFLNRHPDLKIKLTQSLESCQAKALNQKTANDHFDLLESTIKEFNIDLEHMWNMDERGIQLGIGRWIAALVDREQKSVYSVRSGNRDLITIVEAMNAKGKALHSSFIFPVTGLRLKLPQKSRSHASQETLLAENDHLHSLVEKCVEGMSEMYAHMKLMEVENADL
ncbi:hypothetical protein D9758_015870 [Tetrapyrgos nigripes]|uniref:HTH CENPB-type domain-containing protein n=1 Tax=Tetrapyrgos nigripes TaxID=182062 RepID=A0A8H5CKY1_9AGAR|nr:hypothetical protein D9758_015870 [Tetrapyrgos nigripes]